MNKIGVSLGPSFLDGEVHHLNTDCKFEWKAILKNCIQIYYYGNYTDFSPDFGNFEYPLICKTDFAPQKVIAETKSGSKVLLYDGCKFGYNPMLCDIFTDNQIYNRPTTKRVFADNKSNFDIILSAYYQVDFDDEFEGEIKDGLVELVNGSFIPFNKLKRDAFDVFSIKVKHAKNEIYPILEEELS